MSKKNGVCKAGGRSYRRAPGNPAAILSALGFMVLLVFAASHPDTGHAAFPGANGKIAFQSDRDGDYEIYVMNADGSGVTQLTFNTATDIQPAWSPDGSKIAFQSDRDGNFEIYVMNADGTGQTNRTNNPANEDCPAWSPDGTKIAWGSFRDGPGEIYVMNPDGSGQTRLTNNPASDSSPDRQPLPTITVAIDIKPGGFPNSINLKSKGVVPVAILGSPSFNVDDVDVNTVEFAGASPVRFSFQDVNLDGYVDLVFHFRTQDLQLASTDTEAMLTGETTGGTPIRGTDSVRIVK